MATLVNGKIKEDSGRLITPVNGAWYDGQRYLDGQLLGKNEYEPGKFTSAEVNRQSAVAQGVDPNKFQAYLNKPSQPQTVASEPTTTPVFSDGGVGTAGGGGAGALNFGSTSSFDLQKLYDERVTNDPELKKLQDQLKVEQDAINSIKKAAAEQEALINDNPFLAEATLSGKINKLQTKANKEQQVAIDKYNSTLNTYNQRRAEAENRINIAKSQYDINSQEAQTRLAQFNTLLGLGALDGASADEINKLSAMTGMSPQMIASAVDKSRTGKLSVQSYDDGTNQYFVTVDSKGNIVNRQLVGKSKPAAGDGGLDASNWLKTMLGADANGGATIDPIFEELADEVTAPNFAPSNGIGSKYTDALGRVWQFQSSGWVLTNN